MIDGNKVALLRASHELVKKSEVKLDTTMNKDFNKVTFTQIE